MIAIYQTVKMRTREALEPLGLQRVCGLGSNLRQTGIRWDEWGGVGRLWCLLKSTFWHCRDCQRTAVKTQPQIFADCADQLRRSDVITGKLEAAEPIPRWSRQKSELR
jgi:hypothetical protein